jgi:hypothetical protein
MIHNKFTGFKAVSTHVASGMGNSRESLKSFDTSFAPQDSWLKQGQYNDRDMYQEIFVEKLQVKRNFEHRGVE